MAEADELITWLGFKFKPDAKKNIEDAKRSIDMIKEGVKKIGALFLGASGAISYFTNDVMKGAQEMSDLSKKMGISTDVLQQWKYVAEASGQSFDSLVGDLQNYKKVGIDAISLSGRLAGMSSKIALQWKDRLGLSDDMFNVLRQGPKEIKKLMGEAYVIPGQSIEQTAKFNKQLNATKNTLIAMKNEIFMAVSPTLVDLTNKFKDWMQQNKEFIKSKLVDVIKGVALGFQRFVEIAGKAFGYLIDIAKAMGLIGENSPKVESVAKVVTGVLLLWAGGKVAAGLGTLFTILKGIWGIFAAIGKMPLLATAGTKLIGWASAFGKSLAIVAAELKIIWEVFKSLKDFWEKGVSGTIEEYKKKAANGEANFFQKAVIGWGEVGNMFGNWLNPVKPIDQFRVPLNTQGNVTTTNNQNSGNTVILQMPYEQAVNFTRDMTGGQILQMSVVPGAFGPNT